MKVSLNLAQYYSNVDLRSVSNEELVQKIGAQLGAVEDVEDWKAKYEGIVVAKIVSCEKHPDADKLSLCMIDDGGVVQGVERTSERLVQVVCGAPNVREDIVVAWIPPGAAVPSTLDKDPFVLEARELREKVSNGMLASPAELDMSDDHDGILEINEKNTDQEIKIGEPLSNHFGLDDFVVDCENKMFTHRPDCFGNLGIARELAGISGLKFKSPGWYWQVPQFEVKEATSLDVSNDIPELVPRLMVVTMEDIQVGPSPTWMQMVLKRVGMKPINNVVDITNYVMHLTGQPLHAFDYDKLEKASDNPSLFPRMANKGEKIQLLGDKVIKLNENDIVISTDKQAIALAGVMGGAETEVDDNTNTIVIECANFDMYAVRRTSMRHGLFTDAVTRFNKGQSPLQNDRALAYAMKLLSSYASGVQASEVVDIRSSSVDKMYDRQSVNESLVVSTKFINERLGSNLTDDDICKLLQSVEFAAYYSEEDEGLSITAPFWRTDISIGEDIVEEVGRLYGYDKLPVVLPTKSSKAVSKNAVREFKQSMRDKLASAGANEVLTYSFVHGKLLQNTATDPEKWAYHLRNALSPDLQYYRTSLMPSLIAKVRGNIKAQAGSDSNEFALFEIGKAHVKGHYEDSESDKPKDKESLPKQMSRLALVVAADDKTAKKYSGSAYYQAKKYLDKTTHGQATYEPLESMDYPMTATYQKGRSAMVKVNGQVLGVIGEFNGKACKSLKLPNYCAGFELDTDLLLENMKTDKYEPLSTFPNTQQDVTFEVSGDSNWSRLYDFVHAELAVAKAESGYHYELEPLDIFQAESSDKKRISMRISLAHTQKTLKTEEVNKLLDQIARVADEKLQATRI